tara:strand:- start:6854 stop:7048 length:195 start_codon:yes stop_codon:yes gene_type:complete
MKKIQTNQSLRFLAKKNPSRLSMVGDKWSTYDHVLREVDGSLFRTGGYDLGNRDWHTQLRRRDS